MLDPEIVFLNHGSFGALPREVHAARIALTERMEREPVRFFVRDLEPLMDDARRALAAFVRCRAEDLVFVPNATIAVATICQNLESTLRPGDELLATGHEYPACLNSMRRLASRTGSKVVIQPLPFPVRSSDEIVDAVMGAVTPRTRVLLISQVTSPTGLLLPVERIVPELERRGVICIVDGAHAPGMVESLDVASLGASFYTANCHKWICSPKGSAFLHIREDLQAGFRPLALSNSAEKPKMGRKHLQTEFDFIGTQDYTNVLCIPDAIRVMGAMLPGGWADLMRRNRELCLRARTHLCAKLGIAEPAPESMITTLATLLLPEDPDAARAAPLAARPSVYHDALQDAILERHAIQVPVWSIPTETPPRRVFRISAQLHNSFGQYEYLAEAMREELEGERSI
jgi:isopenicillin-N epimerase